MRAQRIRKQRLFTSVPRFMVLAMASGLFAISQIADADTTGAAVEPPQSHGVSVTDSGGRDRGTAAAIGSQACAPAPPNLVSWWSADGHALDLRSRNNGSLVNGTTFATGIVGQAFSFDGVDDGVETFPPDYTMGATMEAWINMTNQGVIMADSGGSAAFKGMGLWVEDGVLKLISTYGNPSQANFVLVGPVVSAGQWHHVAGTWNGTTNPNGAKLYLNGAEVASGQAVTTGTNINGGVNVTIGRGTPGFPYDPFQGLIDEPSVYSRALSHSEVQSIFNAANAGKCKPTATAAPDGLIAWWPGDGTPNDISGNNNHGSVTDGGFAVAKVGQGFQTASTVRVLDSPILRPPNAVSAEMWVKAPLGSPGLVKYLLSKSQSAGVGSYAFYSGEFSGGLTFYVGLGPTIFVESPDAGTSFWDGNFHHLVGTYDGSFVRLYVDGVEIGNGTPASGPIAYGTGLENGDLFLNNFTSDPNGIFKFPAGGITDEFSIYDRALSPSEVESLFNAGIAGKLKESATVETNSIVSLWQGENNALDTRGANNGTFGANTYAPGRVGQAFSLNGVNDFVDVGLLPQINNNATELTVMGWIKRQNGDNNSDGGIVGKWINDIGQPQSFLLMLGGGGFNQNVGAFIVRFDDDTRGFLQDDTIIPNDTWTHLAATWRSSDGSLKLYKNGIEEGSITAGLNRTMRNSGISANIGGWGVSTNVPNPHFPGQIDEPAIFNRALSAAEIRASYEAGNSLTTKVGDATVTFPNVTRAGTTQQIPLDPALFPPLPAATHTGLVYDIATTAGYTGSPTVCFDLPAFTPTQFLDLRVLHLEGDNWVNRTAVSNTYPTLCTNGLSALSPFAIVQPGLTDLAISPTSAAVPRGSLVSFVATGGAAPRTFSIPVNNSGATIDPMSGNYTAGNTAGTDTVRVTDAFGATADATVQVFGVANRLGFVVQPSNTIAGQTITPQVKVAVQDVNGNTIANSSANITLSIFDNPSGGTLSGTVTRQAVNGIATFDDLSINNQGTGYTLRAGSSSLLPALSDPFNITAQPGVPAKLAFIVQPSAAVEDSHFFFSMEPFIQVQIQDGNGDPVPSASALVTISTPPGNPTGLVLVGALARQTFNGVATFESIFPFGVGSGHMLVASASGLQSVTSAPFAVYPEHTVIRTNPAGSGSLQAAIITSNQNADPDTITFDIQSSPPHVIMLSTNLPAITRTTVIDATTQPGYSGTPVVELRPTAPHTQVDGLTLQAPTTVEGLAFTGFRRGLSVHGNGSAIQRSFLGLDPLGSASPNEIGIYVGGTAGGTLIGGPSILDRNIISGNGDYGILFDGTNAGSNHVVEGNFIGTDVNGGAAMPNGKSGVQVFVGAGVTILNNVISGNIEAGVSIQSGASSGGGTSPTPLNVIQGNTIGMNSNGTANVPNGQQGIIVDSARQNRITANRIFGNGGLGIQLKYALDPPGRPPLPNDPGDQFTTHYGNEGQNYPVLTSALSANGSTTVTGSLNSSFAQPYTIEFFSSPTCDLSSHGEGHTYIGSTNVPIDFSGIAGFTAVLPVILADGSYMTATATDVDGNTSEFSRCTIVSARYAISGNVRNFLTAMPNVRMRLENPQGAFARGLTNSAGNFSFGLLPPDDYLLVPEFPDFVFTPVNRAYGNLSQDQTVQDFGGLRETSTVRGSVRTQASGSGLVLSEKHQSARPPVPAGGFPLLGVTFQIIGPVTRTVTNDQYGGYAFNKLPPGSYLVTPSKSNYVFTPPSSVVNVGGPDAVVDFEGSSLGLSTLSGRIMYDAAGEIYAMNADGSGVVKLVETSSHSNVIHSTPRLARNGQRSLHVSRSSVGTQARVVRLNADGSDPAPLFSDSTGSNSPVYSPDGTKIAFNRSGDVLYTMNADGTNVQSIISRCASPDWAPDGTRIVCLEDAGGGTTHVKTVDLVNSTQLTLDSSSGAKYSPRWSPDGSKIAFIRRQAGSPPMHSIVVKHLLGGTDAFMVGTNNLYQTLTWSPDGSRLAFIRNSAAGVTGLRPPGANNQLVTIQSSDGQNMLVIVDGFTGNRIDWGNSNSLPTPESVTPVMVRSGAVSITFPTTSGSGALTTITPIEPNSVGNAPKGFVFGNFAFEISSTSSFTPPVTICVDTDLSGVNLLPPGQPAIFHNENGVLVNITTSFDPNTGILCGQANSFSPFVVATEIDSALPSITGLVLDSNDDPISGVGVSLTGAGNGLVLTDSNGMFKFVNLVSGANYNVQPNLTGFMFTEHSQDFIAITGEQTIIFVGASAAFDIGGAVVDGNGDPVAGVQMLLDGSVTDETVTDANGNYTFNGLPAAGSYFLTPSNSGFFFNPRQISTGSLYGDIASADFVQLAPTAAGVSVGGRIVTADGNGIGSVVVTLTNTADGSNRVVRSNPFGYYKFEDVIAGALYSISVRSKVYEFANPTRVISVHDELTDIDFVALQERSNAESLWDPKSLFTVVAFAASNNRAFTDLCALPKRSMTRFCR